MTPDGIMLPHIGRERPRRGLDWQSVPTVSRVKIPNAIALARFADGLDIATLPLDVTVATLVETLKNGETGERRFAVRDLGRFGPTAAEAVPALIDALGEEQLWLRVETAKALGKIGPAATAAIPTLTAMQDDESVRAVAKQALKDIRDF